MLRLTFHVSIIQDYVLQEIIGRGTQNVTIGTAKDFSTFLHRQLITIIPPKCNHRPEVASISDTINGLYYHVGSYIEYDFFSTLLSDTLSMGQPVCRILYSSTPSFDVLPLTVPSTHNIISKYVITLIRSKLCKNNHDELN